MGKKKKTYREECREAITYAITTFGPDAAKEIICRAVELMKSSGKADDLPGAIAHAAKEYNDFMHEQYEDSPIHMFI